MLPFRVICVKFVEMALVRVVTLSKESFVSKYLIWFHRVYYNFSLLFFSFHGDVQSQLHKVCFEFDSFLILAPREIKLFKVQILIDLSIVSDVCIEFLKNFIWFKRIFNWKALSVCFGCSLQMVVSIFLVDSILQMQGTSNKICTFDFDSLFFKSNV